MKVDIILDSIIDGVRVTTFELYYPRIIHAEFMTHRVFSRNASSSRAIPVKRMIEEHCDYHPDNWRANQAGMQPGKFLDKETSQRANDVWTSARQTAVLRARGLMDLSVAKEQANRLLEPFMYIKVLVTATDYDNFFSLRAHPDAQWEIQQLAYEMKKQYEASEPKERYFHLPYAMYLYEAFPDLDLKKAKSGVIDPGVWHSCVKQSVARCARVSYFSHDGKESTMEKDIKLYERLIESKPPHASPAEHQVFERDFYLEFALGMDWPVLHQTNLSGNLNNPKIVQYRKVLEYKDKYGITNIQYCERCECEEVFHDEQCTWCRDVIHAVEYDQAILNHMINVLIG